MGGFVWEKGAGFSDPKEKGESLRISYPGQQGYYSRKKVMAEVK